MRNAKRGGGVRDPLRIGGAWRVCPRDDELTNERPQRRQEGADIFVDAHPQDDGGGDALHLISPGFDQGRGGGRGMGAIEDEISIPDGDPLEAPWPATGCQSDADGLIRNTNAGCIHNAQSRQRGARVLDLVWARDAEREVGQISPRSYGLEGAPGATPGPIQTSDLERRADLSGGSDNRLVRGRNLRARDGRGAPPQEPP